MAVYHGTVTEQAVQMMAQITAGKKLIFTKMEYGDGMIPGLEDTNNETDFSTLLGNSTILQNKKAELAIEKIEVENETVLLTGIVKDASMVSDFRIRELGVFAKVGEDGEEKLFAYYSTITYFEGVEKDESDWLSFDNLNAGKRKHILGIEIGKTDCVTIDVKLGDTGGYIDRGEFSIFSANTKESLLLREPYDIVINSNAAFEKWASCVDGGYERVLVLPGTWTLNGKMINSIKTGTKYIHGQPGAKLVINYQKGFGVGENSDKKILIENLEIEVNNTNENDTYGVYYGGILRNCNVVVKSANSHAYALISCSGDNVQASGVGGVGFEGYGFKNMSFCTRCRSASVSSSTATWTGTNAYIDTNTCDI